MEMSDYQCPVYKEKNFKTERQMLFPFQYLEVFWTNGKEAILKSSGKEFERNTTLRQKISQDLKF